MSTARRSHAFTRPTPGVPETYRQDVERALQARVKREDELEDEIEAVDAASSSYTDEDARDAIGAALTAGTGISITANDPGDTITIDSTITQYTDEMARDALGAALVAGSGVSIAVNDGADTITVSATTAAADRWVTEIEIDFSSWAATDFASGGDTTYGLDGGGGYGSLTWTAANTANANGGSTTNGGFFRRNASDAGSDGASGLRIFHDPSVSTTIDGSTASAPRLTIPLSSLIPSYDETAEYRVELQVTRFADSSAGTIPTNLCACVWLFGVGGTPTGSSRRLGGATIVRNGANEGAPSVWASNASILAITQSTTYSYTSAGANLIAARWGPDGNVTAYSGTYSGGWPASTGLRAVGTTSQNVTSNAASTVCSRETLLCVGVASRSSATGSVDIMFRRLRVQRRRA